MTLWLQALEMADVPAFAATVAALLHIPFNLLLVPRFGYLGQLSRVQLAQLASYKPVERFAVVID